MTRLPVVKTVGELYPPRCTREFWSFLTGVALTDLDEKGNFVLRRALTKAEKVSLEQRREVLAPWNQPSRLGPLAQAVNGMRVTFGRSRESAEESAAIAMRYAEVLGGLPLWCVERACNKFAGGHVKPEELGGESQDLTFGPSAAQLRRVAEGILAPWAREAARVRMTLMGTPPTIRESDEVRREAGERMLETVEGLKERGRAEALSTEAERRKRHQEAADRAAEGVLREYDALGLARPVDRPGKALVSPSLLMSMGWRIESFADGQRVLMVPTGIVDGGCPRCLRREEGDFEFELCRVAGCPMRGQAEIKAAPAIGRTAAARGSR